MKVAVATAAVPFIWGGAEMLEEALVRNLSARGVEVLHIRIPFAWSTPDDVRRCMAAAAAIELPADVAHLIALKFPAWLITHPRTTAWVFHQFRQVYDLWESGDAGWPLDEEALHLKATVTSADTDALGSAHSLLTYSPVNAARLLRFNGLRADLLFSPMPLSTSFPSGPYSSRLVSFGRVTAMKRQHLIIEALALAETPVSLVIAGVADSAEYERELAELIIERGLQDRVIRLAKFISEEEKAALMEDALASVVTPIDEDNFGYVTAESFLAERPVVTMFDSGGVRWLVEDGVTGLVAASAQDLAAAFDSLYRDRALAERLGQAGAARLRSLKLDWPSAIDRLLA